MTNHVHLLVTPTKAGTVPRLLISLGRRYVQYINLRYARTGTLWDSRYKSSLVQEDPYFLACQRHIELNPVRAGMVLDPAAYRWTSYRRHAFGESAPDLTPHPLYQSLGADDAARQAAYRGLFQLALDREFVNQIRLAASQSQPLGNPRFHAVIAQMTGIRPEVRHRGRPRKTVA
jgi:putative transposase